MKTIEIVGLLILLFSVLLGCTQAPRENVNVQDDSVYVPPAPIPNDSQMASTSNDENLKNELLTLFANFTDKKEKFDEITQDLKSLGDRLNEIDTSNITYYSSKANCDELKDKYAQLSQVLGLYGTTMDSGVETAGDIVSLSEKAIELSARMPENVGLDDKYVTDVQNMKSGLSGIKTGYAALKKSRDELIKLNESIGEQKNQDLLKCNEIKTICDLAAKHVETSISVIPILSSDYDIKTDDFISSTAGTWFVNSKFACRPGELAGEKSDMFYCSFYDYSCPQEQVNGTIAGYKRKDISVQYKITLKTTNSKSTKSKQIYDLTLDLQNCIGSSTLKTSKTSCSLN